MQTHIIENGVVVNTIVATVAEAQAAYPDATCVDATVGGIGWTWDGSTLIAPIVVPPAPTVPQSVTMRQARLALLAVGKLDMINTVIAGIEPAAQRQAIQIEWEYAQTVDRNSPWVAGLAPALALSEADLDSLFVFAAQQ